SGPLGSNLHAVVPGSVYRSAQLSPATLAGVIRSKGLRTVGNLKGGGPQGRRVPEGRATRDPLGAAYFSASPRAAPPPPPPAPRRLRAILDRARLPLLFHCEGGADRSGLVATLYLHLYQGVPLAGARRRGLSWRYGHLPWFGTGAMDDFLALYDREAAGLDLR